MSIFSSGYMGTLLSWSRKNFTKHSLCVSYLKCRSQSTLRDWEMCCRSWKLAFFGISWTETQPNSKVEYKAWWDSRIIKRVNRMNGRVRNNSCLGHSIHHDILRVECLENLCEKIVVEFLKMLHLDIVNNHFKQL